MARTQKPIPPPPPPSPLQNLIFRFLQSRQPVQVWLYDNVNMKIEGKIIVSGKGGGGGGVQKNVVADTRSKTHPPPSSPSPLFL